MSNKKKYAKKKLIKNYQALKRFKLKIHRKRLKKAKRRHSHELTLAIRREFGDNFSYENVLQKWLPTNLAYLIIWCEKSEFYITKLKSAVPKNNGIFKVPKNFSLVDGPKECFDFIRGITAALITQSYKHIKIDYKECTRVDLGAQVFLDIILKDIITFFNRCNRYRKTKTLVEEIEGINVRNEDIQKLLFSVGSPAIHMNQTIKFNDIVPYKLCIHNNRKNAANSKTGEQKDIDTTKLVDYVLDSLKRLNIILSSEKIDNLCTVIGEILINAEEHSTTGYRFSIGYFHEINKGGKHYGVFRLVILNFGQTIYEKFADPNCPNKGIVTKMKDLSNSYNKRNIFFQKQFEEETLWTLYALQEGVTSISPDRYKRGNGSIQFIESFFNIKGIHKTSDEVSRMTIKSGNATIMFDGTYNIVEKEIQGEPFKIMTFNTSDSIEEKPDERFVMFSENYFPGTIISARIMFNEDDLRYET